MQRLTQHNTKAGAPCRWLLVMAAFGVLTGSPEPSGAVETSPETTATERMEKGPAALDGVGIDEKLGGQVPLQLRFNNAEGEAVALNQLITTHRPTILTLNYSSCPMLCSLQLDGFVNGLRDLAWTIGEQFDIITVSIDPHEARDRTQAFRDKYLGMYEREAAREGWQFLTGDEKNIRALADAVGFKYKYVEDHKEYAHAAAVMVLSPEGIVSRYLYGVIYEPRDLRFALVEAAEGKVGSTLDRILLYCFHYDATVGRYAPVAANIMRLGGLVTVVALVGVLGIFWFKDERKQRIPLG